MLVDEVRQWVHHERQQWAGRRLLLSEQRFGPADDVQVMLPDGRSIAVTGSIDRVDQRADGSLLVTDHKTGSAKRFKDLATDPTLGGTHFQLPIYAAAARRLTGRPDAAVRAEYSFFAKENYRRLGAEIDADAWSIAMTQLAHVVAGIEAGVFPSRPDRPGWQLYVSCHYCDPDGLGTTERWPEWERKHTDPRVARWFGAIDDSEDES